MCWWTSYWCDNSVNKYSFIIIDDYRILLMYIAEWCNDWHDSKSLSRQRVTQNSFTCNKGYQYKLFHLQFCKRLLIAGLILQISLQDHQVSLLSVTLLQLCYATMIKTEGMYIKTQIIYLLQGRNRVQVIV